MVAVEAQGLLELGGGGDQLAVGGEQAAAAGSGTRRCCRPVGSSLSRRVAGLVDLARPAEGADAVQLGALGVVARPWRRRRRPRRRRSSAGGSPGRGRGRSGRGRGRRPCSGGRGRRGSGRAAPRRRPGAGGSSGFSAPFSRSLDRRDGVAQGLGTATGRGRGPRGGRPRPRRRTGSRSRIARTSVVIISAIVPPSTPQAKSSQRPRFARVSASSTDLGRKVPL